MALNRQIVLLPEVISDDNLITLPLSLPTVWAKCPVKCQEFKNLSHPTPRNMVVFYAGFYFIWPHKHKILARQNGYNIPWAYLLNRSPVPAIDLKNNRSGLWRHMLAELVADWEDYVANVQTISRDMIKLQLSQYFCRATRVSCRVGVTLCCDFYIFRSCNTCTYSLPPFAALRHTTFYGVARYIVKHLFYETAWSILFWNHTNYIISLVKVQREYSPVARILHTKFDKTCDIIFMVSKKYRSGCFIE